MVFLDLSLKKKSPEKPELGHSYLIDIQPFKRPLSLEETTVRRLASCTVFALFNNFATWVFMVFHRVQLESANPAAIFQSAG